MPEIFKDLALYGEIHQMDKKLNPLENGLIWLRGMDTLPLLKTESDLINSIIKL
jgi:carbamoyl-phosphate synthase large subunit